MEERSKTIMCSVLFLDIVEYSKKSVSGQISLKERFNAFLSVAIRDVPLDDRIILDTGDGAALSFLGDVEDALQVALSLRESLRSQGALMEPALLVRMGINLGPVRLVKDINGQPNIVGDGINVAQRIMAFSDPGQILVSRSYYDAVSRLSPEYADTFHYQGSRTDKHVREHEIYAIGYPGEFTAQQPAAMAARPRKPGFGIGALQQSLAKSWQSAAQRLGQGVQSWVNAYRAAAPRTRAIYGGSLAALLVLVGVASVLMLRAPAPEQGAATQLAEVAGGQAAAPAAGDAKQPAAVEQAASQEKKSAAAEKKTVPPAKDKGKQKATDGKASKTARTEEQSKSKPEEKTSIFGTPLAEKGPPGFLAISCMEGSAVFVDGFSKGVIGKGALNISLDPGKHQLTITHTGKSSVYSEAITIKAGETVRLHPSFCD